MSYPVLLSTLDSLRKEAPKEYSTYHPKNSDAEKVNQARAKAFLHLFLKVRFGLPDFKTRHAFVCDGGQDGGVDAYYIDRDNRVFYLIQAKFRTSEKNFEAKSIDASEILRMEVARISKGEETDSNGQPFSSRISALQKEIRAIRDIALYDWKVVFLANLVRVNDEQLRRLIDNMEYEVFDYARTYRELVFPLATGTYFKPEEIKISINLGSKTSHQLSQEVDTPLGPCKVRLIFVPIEEVAKVTAKYQNSLLRYNPRNYLSLQNNEVNKSIRDTVLNTNRNEFSLKNNGITILAEYSSVTDRTGVSGEGQLIVKDPQILNGGQTATTLSMIHEDPKVGSAVFGDKEVLLKIIEKPTTASEDDLLTFIETISDATNQQSRIVEADRRANDPKLLRLQQHFFDKFGMFLERKRGEFQYGLDSRVIKRASIINRVDLLRAMTAFEGQASRARKSANNIFEERRFADLLADYDIERTTRAYFTLRAIEEANRERRAQDLPAVTAGKYALVAASARVWHTRPVGHVAVQQEATEIVGAVMNKWSGFQTHIKVLPKNARYDEPEPEGFNFDGYYKGSTVDTDVLEYDWD